MILDIETYDIIGICYNGDIYIPHIREISFIIIKPNDLNVVFQQEIKNFKTYNEIIDALFEVLEKFNYPTIIAHNGSNFDFPIINAHIQRYGTKENIKNIQKLKYYDSFTTLKEKYYDCSELKTIIDSKNYNKKFSNTSMFKTFQDSYKEELHLLNFAHTSLADCKMLLYWFNKFINF